MSRLDFSRPESPLGEVLPEELKRQALLLELTPVLLRDPEDKIVYWNRAAEVMYGFSREEAVGRLSHELLQTEFPEPLGQILARLRSGRQWDGELTRTRNDGAKITVASEWIAYLDDRGVLEAIIEVNREVTDRKQAEAALAFTRGRFDAILASAMDAIISVDANQRIILFNPAAERMFGVTSAEAMGQGIDRFIPQRFREAHAGHFQQFQHTQHTGASLRNMGALGTIAGLRANGEEFPIEASISHVEIGGEQVLTVILRDITRRQQSEAALHKAEADLRAHAAGLEATVAERTAQLRDSVAELEAFSYSLSHDLRAPLRAVNTFTSIVLEDHGASLPPEAADLLQKVVGAAARMDRLIQDVLAFSRVVRQPVELRPMDVERLLRDIIQGRPDFQAARAEIKLESPLLPMLGHEPSMVQCLANLLGNAVKFVSPGVQPRVRIWTELRNEPPNLTGAGQPATVPPKVRLWVEDNGIGIEPESHQRIFEIFQRLSSAHEGTGIGLAIVKKAAERMGGSVGVESQAGQGSRFWVELPPG